MARTLVRPRAKTMVVFGYGGHSVWLEPEAADALVVSMKKRRRRRLTGNCVAYVVRCYPHTTQPPRNNA